MKGQWAGFDGSRPAGRHRQASEAERGQSWLANVPDGIWPAATGWRAGESLIHRAAYNRAEPANVSRELSVLAELLTELGTAIGYQHCRAALSTLHQCPQLGLRSATDPRPLTLGSARPSPPQTYGEANRPQATGWQGRRGLYPIPSPDPGLEGRRHTAFATIERQHAGCSCSCCSFQSRPGLGAT